MLQDKTGALVPDDREEIIKDFLIQLDENAKGNNRNERNDDDERE